jgi:tRNA 2-thiouridine synthesizing protein A
MLTITTPLSDTDLAALEGAKVVDARGSACPGPLLEAKKGMATIAVGQVIEIW